MPSSQVVVLPIFGTGTGTKVTAGTVTPNYPARAKTDALLTGEWWPALDDPLSLIDIAVGLPNTLLPVGQFGDATFPTLSSTEFSIPAGKNGLTMPYDDTAASTIMLVVKCPPSGVATIVGNFSDISGSTADGIYMYWTGTTVYYTIRGLSVQIDGNLNAPSQGATSSGEYVFIYLREDATGANMNFGGSTNPEKAPTANYPRTVSARRKSIGNLYVGAAAYIANDLDVAWVGYADSKLDYVTEIAPIYTAIKGLLATAGITVK